MRPALKEKFPSHVVCAWLGNSRPVAQDHYLPVTDAHFAAAVVEPEKKLDQAAQNQAHSAAVSTGNEQEQSKAGNENRSALPSDASSCECLHGMKVTPTGFEPVSRP